VLALLILGLGAWKGHPNGNARGCLARTSADGPQS
jgi:hypothetical protein